MQANEMKRDMEVTHPELGSLRLTHPVGPHRFLDDGTAFALVPVYDYVLIEPSGAEKLLAEEEGRVLQPVLSNDMRHTGRWEDSGKPCAQWYAVSLSSWEQVVVTAEHVTAKS
jgi:hypothetical protein